MYRIDPERVFIVGTPQLDFHFKANITGIKKNSAAILVWTLNAQLYSTQPVCLI